MPSKLRSYVEQWTDELGHIYERTWYYTPWRRVWTLDETSKYYQAQIWRKLKRLKAAFKRKTKTLSILAIGNSDVDPFWSYCSSEEEDLGKQVTTLEVAVSEGQKLGSGIRRVDNMPRTLPANRGWEFHSVEAFIFFGQLPFSCNNWLKLSRMEPNICGQ